MAMSRDPRGGKVIEGTLELSQEAAAIVWEALRLLPCPQSARESINAARDELAWLDEWMVKPMPLLDEHSIGHAVTLAAEALVVVANMIAQMSRSNITAMLPPSERN